MKRCTLALCATITLMTMTFALLAPATAYARTSDPVNDAASMLQTSAPAVTTIDEVRLFQTAPAATFLAATGTTDTELLLTKRAYEMTPATPLAPKDYVVKTEMRAVATGKIGVDSVLSDAATTTQTRDLKTHVMMTAGTAMQNDSAYTLTASKDARPSSGTSTVIAGKTSTHPAKSLTA